MDDNTLRLFQSAWNVLGMVGLLLVGSALIAYFVFRALGTKWLDTKFSERLEKYKHEQQRELEALKFRINGLIDRAAKIHVKEFEYLPAVWVQLNVAYRATQQLLGGLREVPNLDAMTEARLDEFLDTLDIDDFDKSEIKASKNKNSMWSQLLDIRSYNLAVNEHAELRKVLGQHAIFFSENMRDQIESVADLIWRVIIEFNVYSLHRDPEVKIVREARKEMRENGEVKLRHLENNIRDRLWNAEHATL